MIIWEWPIFPEIKEVDGKGSHGTWCSLSDGSSYDEWPYRLPRTIRTVNWPNSLSKEAAYLS